MFAETLLKSHVINTLHSTLHFMLWCRYSIFFQLESQGGLFTWSQISARWPKFSASRLLHIFISGKKIFFFFSRICCRFFDSYNLMILTLTQKSELLLLDDSGNLSKLEGRIIVHTTLFCFVNNINFSVFSRPQVQRSCSYEERVVFRGLFLSKGMRFVHILYCF